MQISTKSTPSLPKLDEATEQLQTRLLRLSVKPSPTTG
jgi:hypothetical protein